jgi:hypothetical protein
MQIIIKKYQTIKSLNFTNQPKTFHTKKLKWWKTLTIQLENRA